jgi:uncharacterized protein YkwD
LISIPKTAARAGLALLALLFCVACASETAAPIAPALPPPDPKTQMAALETRIFELIQDERHKIDPKAKVLALDSELTGVARKRSADMAAKNYMAHAGPDGQTSAGLIMDQDQDFQGLLGENIAEEHYAPASGVNVESTAQAFVKTWMDSPDHKENLSYPPYDRSGVGAAVNGDTVYVTQLFATDLGLPKHSPDPKARKVTKLAHPDATPPVVPEPRPASDISP